MQLRLEAPYIGNDFQFVLLRQAGRVRNGLDNLFKRMREISERGIDNVVKKAAGGVVNLGALTYLNSVSTGSTRS